MHKDNLHKVSPINIIFENRIIILLCLIVLFIAHRLHEDLFA